MIVFPYYQIKWDMGRWPNFTPREFACKCCGELVWAPEYFDAAQSIRNIIGKPLVINSGHRCPIHNARVGGSPRSQHKYMALDLSVAKLDPEEVLKAAYIAGLRTFGYYGSFLHTDFRPGRRWATAAGKRTWKGIMI